MTRPSDKELVALLLAAADALEAPRATTGVDGWDDGLRAAIQRGNDARRMLTISSNQERRTWDEQDELDALCQKHPDLT